MSLGRSLRDLASIATRFLGKPSDASAITREDRSVRALAIDVDALKARLDGGEEIALFDVRTAFERRRGYIPGSQHLPLTELPARAAKLPKDLDIVIYCLSGTRSIKVASYLRKKGFRRVRNCAGGWRAWSANGYPVQKDE